MAMSSLLCARWVVPVEPSGTVLENHAVAVREGRIESVLHVDEASRRFSQYERVDLPEHVLVPGLINAHTHAAMTLMRGMADDLPLKRWLEEHIWPAEMKHVSPQFVKDGTLLACAEMLRGGTTCFNDMYFFPEAAIEAALESGMRAAAGMIVIEFPSAYASDPDDYLQKGLALRDRYSDHPSLSFCLAPHAPYTVSDGTFRKVAKLSAELDLPVHIHVHETADEVERSIAEHGSRPLERLRRLDLLGPGLISVHSVHLLPEEVNMLARHGCTVVHCPSSNLKLASGFAPVATLLQAGVMSLWEPMAQRAITGSTCFRRCATRRSSPRLSGATPKRCPRTPRFARQRLQVPSRLALAPRRDRLLSARQPISPLCDSLVRSLHRALIPFPNLSTQQAGSTSATSGWRVASW